MGSVSEPLINGLPTTFTAAQAQQGGLTRRRLASLHRDGTIERIGRGVYRRSAAPLVDEDLLEIAVKTHRPTLCLISALARHELTDQIPSRHDIAVPRGQWRPTVSTAVRWHKFDRATFDVGRTEIAVDPEIQDRSVRRAPQHHRRIPVAAHHRTRRGQRGTATVVACRRPPGGVVAVHTIVPPVRPAILNALQILL